MKKRVQKKAVWLSVCLTALMLAGCGSAASSKTEADAYAYASNGAYAQDAGVQSDEVCEVQTQETAAAGNAEGKAEATEELGQSVASNRKLIKRVDLSVETREFDKLTANIEAKVEKLGGYMESSNIYGSSYSYDTTKSADFTARVPVDKLNELVSAVSDSSNVTSRSESATDVTLSYVDTQSQKEAYEVELDRLMEILKQAQDVETIVALESRLTEVRYQIQNLESQLRTYDNLVDYATVTIHISEVELYTPDVTAPKTDFEKMTEGFKASAYKIGKGFQNFGIGFVIVLPYLFVWALIILAIIGIVRWILRAKKRKDEKKKAEPKKQTEKGKSEEQE